MKKTLFFTFTLPMLLFLSCKKDEVETAAKEDKIAYTIINKTIIPGETATMFSGCDSLVYGIDTTAENVSQEVRFKRCYDDDCNGDAYFKISSSRGAVDKRFLNNDIINAKANWTTELFVDSLAGKGEVFIAFKEAFYPSGQDRICYGWIRLSLSADKKELKIIDRAKNLTEGNAIKAGQIE